jgi:hypothetical protein
LISEIGVLARHDEVRRMLEPNSNIDVQALLDRFVELPLSRDFQDSVVHGQMVSQVLPEVDAQLHEIIAT